MSLRAAFDENLTHYKQQIPPLFWFNALRMASNGTGWIQRQPTHRVWLKNCSTRLGGGKARRRSIGVQAGCEPGKILSLEVTSA